jgi:hypothetical protein
MVVAGLESTKERKKSMDAVSQVVIHLFSF